MVPKSRCLAWRRCRCSLYRHRIDVCLERVVSGERGSTSELHGGYHYHAAAGDSVSKRRALEGRLRAVERHEGCRDFAASPERRRVIAAFGIRAHRSIGVATRIDNPGFRARMFWTSISRRRRASGRKFVRKTSQVSTSPRTKLIARLKA